MTTAKFQNWKYGTRSKLFLCKAVEGVSFPLDDLMRGNSGMKNALKSKCFSACSNLVMHAYITEHKNQPGKDLEHFPYLSSQVFSISSSAV